MRRLFIVNSLSERVARKGSVLHELYGDTEDIFYLDPFDHLPSAVERAAIDKVEHVIIEGGDGTVQGVISEFLRQEDRFANFPKFSIIPGGMTNQVAKNIGFASASPHRVKTKLASELSPTNNPLLIASELDGPDYSGFLFSTGAIPQITRYTTGQLHRKGIGGSLAVFGGILKGIRGDDATLMQLTSVHLDDLYEGEHLGTVITTLPGLILGLDPFWGEEEAPLRLTWVTSGYKKLGRNILGLWLGRKSVDRRKDGIFSVCRNEINYSYSGPVVLDGEFLSFPSGKFTVRASRPVTFLR